MVHPPTIASSGLTLPRETDQSQYKPTAASGALAMSANQLEGVGVNSASEPAQSQIGQRSGRRPSGQIPRQRQ